MGKLNQLYGDGLLHETRAVDLIARVVQPEPKLVNLFKLGVVAVCSDVLVRLVSVAIVLLPFARVGLGLVPIKDSHVFVQSVHLAVVQVFQCLLRACLAVLDLFHDGNPADADRFAFLEGGAFIADFGVEGAINNGRELEFAVFSLVGLPFVVGLILAD